MENRKTEELSCCQLGFRAVSGRTQENQPGEEHVLAWEAERGLGVCVAMVEFCRRGQSTEAISGEGKGGTCSELSHLGRRGP